MKKLEISNKFKKLLKDCNEEVRDYMESVMLGLLDDYGHIDDSYYASLRLIRDNYEIYTECYDAIKSNVMLQVAQKTIKEMFGQEVTSDDLNLDLDYLMNSEIFGIGYEDEDADDEEDEDGSLLDELNDEDDDIDGMDDEDELTE